MVSAAENRTVNIWGWACVRSGIAGEALKVGAHVNLISGEVMLRDTGTPTKMIVAEASERGMGVFDNDGAISAYVDGEEVSYLSSSAGERRLILLANGQNVAEGAILEAAANGEWVAQSSGVGGFFALEAINNTTGAAVLIAAQAL